MRSDATYKFFSRFLSTLIYRVLKDGGHRLMRVMVYNCRVGEQNGACAPEMKGGDRYGTYEVSS